jgi:hypothetical protein
MLQPATLNLVVPQGATYRKQLVLPLDFSDREVVAQIWKVRGTSARSAYKPFTRFEKLDKVADFDVLWDERSFEEGGITKGRFALHLTAELTAAFEEDQRMDWDLLVIDGTTLHAGDKAFWLRGAIIIDPTLTEVDANV